MFIYRLGLYSKHENSCCHLLFNRQSFQLFSHLLFPLLVRHRQVDNKDKAFSAYYTVHVGKSRYSGRINPGLLGLMRWLL